MFDKSFYVPLLAAALLVLFVAAVASLWLAVDRAVFFY